jgi:hypothetical protein
LKSYFFSLKVFGAKNLAVVLFVDVFAPPRPGRAKNTKSSPSQTINRYQAQSWTSFQQGIDALLPQPGPKRIKTLAKQDNEWKELTDDMVDAAKYH